MAQPNGTGKQGKQKPLYRLATEEDFKKNPKWGELYSLQQKPVDAHQGELGVLVHPDERTISTEVSTTVQLKNGEWVNIPLLVRGQSPEAINRIISGKPIDQDYYSAVNRFMERTQKDKLPYTSFKTLQEAVASAEGRSAHKLTDK